MTDHLIHCVILTGSAAGEIHFINRTYFEFGGDPDNPSEGPVRCTRIQFPLRPGCVMTINKAQGMHVKEQKFYFRSNIITCWHYS